MDLHFIGTWAASFCISLRVKVMAWISSSVRSGHDSLRFPLMKQGKSVRKRDGGVCYLPSPRASAGDLAARRARSLTVKRLG